jgi:hypothetical protein
MTPHRATIRVGVCREKLNESNRDKRIPDTVGATGRLYSIFRVGLAGGRQETESRWSDHNDASGLRSFADKFSTFHPS